MEMQGRVWCVSRCAQKKKGFKKIGPESTLGEALRTKVFFFFFFFEKEFLATPPPARYKCVCVCLYMNQHAFFVSAPIVC